MKVGNQKVNNTLESTLREDVARICPPPTGRLVGSEGHREVREYLSGRMEELGLRPYRGSSFGMAFRDSGQKFFNLVGVVPCGKGTRPPVLIGAHYDSVIDAPCADDSAAAVAIALAAAGQLLTDQKLNRDVIIAFFDAEEPPYIHTKEATIDLEQGPNSDEQNKTGPEGHDQ